MLCSDVSGVRKSQIVTKNLPRKLMNLESSLSEVLDELSSRYTSETRTPVRQKLVRRVEKKYFPQAQEVFSQLTHFQNPWKN